MADELIEIGYVVRTHGVKGHVRISFNDHIKELSVSEALYFLVRGAMLPFFIEELEYLKDGTVIVKLEELHSMEEAGLYTKRPIYGPPEYLLPAEEEEEPALLDYLVVDERLGELGKVCGMIDMGEYALIEIIYQDRALMIPLHQDSLLGVDDAAKTIRVRLPEGLLNL